MVFQLIEVGQPWWLRLVPYGREKVRSRLIEVKSTTLDSVFISRNEWRNAASAEAHYWFHVWKLPEGRFVEYPVAAIRPSIPIDQGTGEWQEVRVALEPSFARQQDDKGAVPR